MYFLVNASPPKLLDVAASNFADALVSSKAGICDGVPSNEVSKGTKIRNRYNQVPHLV